MCGSEWAPLDAIYVAMAQDLLACNLFRQFTSFTVACAYLEHYEFRTGRASPAYRARILRLALFS